MGAQVSRTRMGRKFRPQLKNAAAWMELSAKHRDMARSLACASESMAELCRVLRPCSSPCHASTDPHAASSAFVVVVCIIANATVVPIHASLFRPRAVKRTPCHPRAAVTPLLNDCALLRPPRTSRWACSRTTSSSGSTPPRTSATTRRTTGRTSSPWPCWPRWARTTF